MQSERGSAYLCCLMLVLTLGYSMVPVFSKDKMKEKLDDANPLETHPQAPPRNLTSPDDITRMKLMGEDNYYKYLKDKSDAEELDELKKNAVPFNHSLTNVDTRAIKREWRNRIEDQIHRNLLEEDERWFADTRKGNISAAANAPLIVARPKTIFATCIIQFTLTRGKRDIGATSNLQFLSRSPSKVFDDMVEGAVSGLNYHSMVLKFPPEVKDDTVKFKLTISRLMLDETDLRNIDAGSPSPKEH